MFALGEASFETHMTQHIGINGEIGSSRLSPASHDARAGRAGGSMNSLRQFSSRIGLTDALLRIGDEIVDFWYKGFAAWLMTAACVASVYIKPLWPISYYTGVWMLGVFFPLSALLFLTFNLRIRFKEIREVAGSNRYPSVYYPGLDVSAAERKF